MKKQIQIIVTGRVQGVFFRKHAVQKARELGITGFIRNMPDNTVYLEAQGDDDVLSLFIDWCYTGSPQSQVENVEASEMKNLSDFIAFEMRG